MEIARPKETGLPKEFRDQHLSIAFRRSFFLPGIEETFQTCDLILRSITVRINWTEKRFKDAATQLNSNALDVLVFEFKINLPEGSRRGTHKGCRFFEGTPSVVLLPFRSESVLRDKNRRHKRSLVQEISEQQRRQTDLSPKAFFEPAVEQLFRLNYLPRGRDRDAILILSLII